MHLAPDEAARRHAALASRFREQGVSVWRSEYDGLAVLTCRDHPAERVLERVLDHRRIERLRPVPGVSMSFHLAASVAFLELMGRERDRRVITDLRGLHDLQAAFEA